MEVPWWWNEWVPVPHAIWTGVPNIPRRFPGLGLPSEEGRRSHCDWTTRYDTWHSRRPVLLRHVQPVLLSPASPSVHHTDPLSASAVQVINSALSASFSPPLIIPLLNSQALWSSDCFCSITWNRQHDGRWIWRIAGVVSLSIGFAGRGLGDSSAVTTMEGWVYYLSPSKLRLNHVSKRYLVVVGNRASSFKDKPTAAGSEVYFSQSFHVIVLKELL